MKTYTQTRDVLEHVRNYHKLLSEFYQHLEDKAEKQRVKLLLDYLSRHEKHFDECLAVYNENASKMVMNTWYQYTPQIDPSELLEEVALTPEMSVDDVIRVALRLDNYLIDLYQMMAENAEIPEVREVFMNLLGMEQQEKREQAKNALSIKGI